MTGYGMGDIVAMKKPHPCGCNEWRIMRLGAENGHDSPGAV